jgi:hypothetical protein
MTFKKFNVGLQSALKTNVSRIALSSYIMYAYEHHGWDFTKDTMADAGSTKSKA